MMATLVWRMVPGTCPHSDSILDRFTKPLATERGAGEEVPKSAARGLPGPVPGSRGVPGGVLEAVPL